MIDHLTLLLASIIGFQINVSDNGVNIPKSTASLSQMDGQRHVTVMMEMAHDIVGRHALDGVPVTALKRDSGCATSFATANAVVIVDWSKQPDSPAIIKRGQQFMLLTNISGKRHELALGSGGEAAGIKSAIVLLVLDCEKQNKR